MENWRIRQKKRREGANNNTKQSSNTSSSRLNAIQQHIPLMNRETIRTIGEFSSLRVERPLIGSSSISINNVGEIFYLCDDGVIRFLSSSSPNDGQLGEEGRANSSYGTQQINLKSNPDLNEMQICHLEFNYSNTSLLVAGSQCVGVIFLKNLVKNNEEEMHLENYYDFQIFHRCLIGDFILKVQWHPLSDTHLVLLLQSHKILLVDVLTGQITEIPLDETTDYISFTFGPCVDWMRLCLFLVDATGAISYLCPVLPYGSILSSHSIYEFKQWIADERMRCEELSSPKQPLLDNIDLYLRASFGTYFDQYQSTAELSDEDSEPPQHSFHRAGVPKNGSHLTPGTLFHKSFYQIPRLQGPLSVENRIVSCAASSASARHRSNETIPCDICVPVARGYNSVPVLLVAWSDGNIEELLISGQIAPRWREDRLDNASKASSPLSDETALPVLVHMETLSLNLYQDFKENSRQALTVSLPQDEYYLLPDPILGHSFHLIGPTSGVSYLIYVNWLEREFNPSSSATASSSHSHDSPIGRLSSSANSGLLNEENGPSSSSNQTFQSSTVLITCDGNQPSTQSQSRAQNSDRQISGVFVCPDPTQGHVQLVRYTDGFLSAANITIQRKLLQLEGRIKNRNAESDSSLSSSLQGLTPTTAADNIFEQKEYSLQWIRQKLIKKALVGIESVPYMGGNRQASTAECLESLLDAKQHLDAHVILPLEQLYQRIRFNEQIVRDVYEGQVALLTAGAVSGEEDHKRAERKATELREEVNGIENKIRLIQANQRKLKERIENVGKKLIQQKNLSASALSTSQATRNKISYAERSYYAQLQTWEDMCGKMEKLMAHLILTKEYLQSERYPYPSPAAAAVMNSSHRGAGAGATGVMILLSPQEEEICQNLLGSQGEALKATNAAALELEDRLHSLM